MKPYDAERDKKSQIREMFDNIAPTYDRLNHLLSMNIDRLWRRSAVNEVARRRPSAVLDIATGTGDMAIALAKKMPDATVDGIDLSTEMLEVARMKIEASGLSGRVTAVCCDAERMPFDDRRFDAVTVAFGVRNFENIDEGLREMHRVLKDGGVLVVLELSTPRNRVVKALYDFYSHRILPFAGRSVSKDGKAYEYLPASVEEFPAPERFAEMIRAAGFASVRIESKSFGIATIYIAEK